jgi:hypothetical protein
VNMIVNDLWNDWGEKAFLMYRAFAGEPHLMYRFCPYRLTSIELNYKLHIIRSLGVDRLSIIAQNAVEKRK